jgi:hypothetical protein
VTLFCLVFFTEEADRILQCKGRIYALKNEPHLRRVWLPHEEAPGLAMSRTFGDFCLKDYGIIAVPELSYRQLTDQDQFVVLATDGVRASPPPTPCIWAFYTFPFQYWMWKKSLVET